MTRNLKIGFILSFLIHSFLLFGLSIFSPPKSRIITIPVDFIYYTAYPQVKTENISVPTKTIPRTHLAKKFTQPAAKSPPAAKEEPAPPAPPVPASSSLNIEAVRFPYTYYLNQVRKKISENWMWSQTTSGSFRTVIYFRIYRDGQISEPVYKEHSGSQAFDSLAWRAIKTSAPFPPLPDGYPEDNLGIYFEFNYR